MHLDGVIGLLDKVRPTSNGYQARCPAHADQSPSLSIRQGEDGKILLHCFAGCDIHSICQALGWSLPDLFPDPQRDPQLIRRAKRQREHRERVQRTHAQLIGAHAVIHRELEALIRAGSPIEVSDLTDKHIGRLLNSIGEAHNALRREMGDKHYAEWSSRLGGNHCAGRRGEG